MGPCSVFSSIKLGEEGLETKVLEADKTQLSHVNHQLLWSLLTSKGGSTQSLSSGHKPSPDSHWERKRSDKEENEHSMLEDTCVQPSQQSDVGTIAES